jgi:hypothetical protein
VEDDTQKSKIAKRKSGDGMLRYATTIFISAFLLFQVQPIITKIILPWFGGSAAVWTTCLLFFQIALLMGYLYAHGSVRLLSPRTQGRVHAGLLALSLFALPILPREFWKPTGAEDPTLRILLLLAVTIGLPYFLLSTTGPLLQAWYANDTSETGGGPRPFPYRLYALSNIGSMLALLGYPTLVEPFLTLRQQAFVWTFGYAVFVLLCAYVALRIRGDAWAQTPVEAATSQEPPLSPDAQAPYAPPHAAPDFTAAKPNWRDYLLWTLLAACSCSLLLSITTHLTQNVAPIPFLWVLPLCLYLLSFIVCFGGKEWRWRLWFLPLPALALGGMTFFLSLSVTQSKILPMILVLAGGLFICCLLCHGELARRKPAPRYLTVFYLMISLGGALGGIFVGLVAPRLFGAEYELQIGLGVCGLIALGTLYWQLLPFWSRTIWMLMAGATVVLLIVLGKQATDMSQGYRLTARNFYGTLKVSEPYPDQPQFNRHVLTNGLIMHGDQFLAPEKRREPTTYYWRETGVGLTIQEGQKHGPLRVGMIGLGTGTLASYGRAGDVYHFYEINPLVVEVAKSEFSYLQDCPAQTEVRMGDARLTLERLPPQNYDVLVVDAFSSDAIPVHLLTQEAMQLYFRHLKPSGVLAVHISNQYLNLLPVVVGEARSLSKASVVVHTDGDYDLSHSITQWVLVTGRTSLFADPLFRNKEKVQTTDDVPSLRVWTDDYSNLLQILK